MTEEKTLTGDEVGKLSVDELVDWEFDRFKKVWVYRPLTSVIGTWLYDQLSAEKKKEFVFDQGANRYRKQILVPKDA